MGTRFSCPPPLLLHPHLCPLAEPDRSTAVVSRAPLPPSIISLKMAAISLFRRPTVLACRYLVLFGVPERSALEEAFGEDNPIWKAVGSLIGWVSRTVSYTYLRRLHYRVIFFLVRRRQRLLWRKSRSKVSTHTHTPPFS